MRFLPLLVHLSIAARTILYYTKNECGLSDALYRVQHLLGVADRLEANISLNVPHFFLAKQHTSILIPPSMGWERYLHFEANNSNTPRLLDLRMSSIDNPLCEKPINFDPRNQIKRSSLLIEKDFCWNLVGFFYDIIGDLEQFVVRATNETNSTVILQDSIAVRAAADKVMIAFNLSSADYGAIHIRGPDADGRGGRKHFQDCTKVDNVVYVLKRNVLRYSTPQHWLIFIYYPKHYNLYTRLLKMTLAHDSVLNSTSRVKSFVFEDSIIKVLGGDIKLGKIIDNYFLYAVNTRLRNLAKVQLTTYNYFGECLQDRCLCCPVRNKSLSVQSSQKAAS